MNLFNRIKQLLKGRKYVGGTQECISGGRGRECRSVYPVETARKRAISDFGGIRMLAKACADERSRDPGALPTDSILAESRVLIEAAKKVGCFVNAKDVPGTRYTIRSGESEVRIVQKDGVYYKIKDPFAKAHLKKHPLKYILFEHITHNILFPECPLEFIGIAEENHEARIVYRQKAIRSEYRPTDDEIAIVLQGKGLLPSERYCFGNELLFVTDVGHSGDNVLCDDNGTPCFIDPIIGFRQKLCQLFDVTLLSWIEGDIIGDLTKEEAKFFESMTNPMKTFNRQSHHKEECLS